MLMEDFCARFKQELTVLGEVVALAEFQGKLQDLKSLPETEPTSTTQDPGVFKQPIITTITATPNKSCGVGANIYK